MDLYVILGVERSASAGDLKRAYRRLARKYHPDINPGDRETEAVFRRVTEAYEILVDPERRQDYDAHGLAASRPPAGDVAFEGFDFSGASAGEPASSFGDLFAEVIAGSGRRPPGDAPAVDLHATLQITFGQAMRGGAHEVTVSRVAACGACAGTGIRRVAESRCSGCGGLGHTRWTRGHMVFSRRCAECGGTGRRRHRPCGACGAEGVLSRIEAVPVAVPAGVAGGTRLRVQGGGNAGRRGGPTGDLYVTVTVEPHPLFRREGDDLHLVLPIAVHEAALGARVEVPTIGDPARVRIPPGAQSGQRLRVRGRGAPSPGAGAPGDLIVEIRIVLPRVLDERSKELMRQLADNSTEDVRAGLW